MSCRKDMSKSDNILCIFNFMAHTFEIGISNTWEKVLIRVRLHGVDYSIFAKAIIENFFSVLLFSKT